jgi:hypothetical protein
MVDCEVANSRVTLQRDYNLDKGTLGHLYTATVSQRPLTLLTKRAFCEDYAELIPLLQQFLDRIQV